MEIHPILVETRLMVLAGKIGDQSHYGFMLWAPWIHSFSISCKDVSLKCDKCISCQGESAKSVGSILMAYSAVAEIYQSKPKWWTD